MRTGHERFVTDKDGKRTAVLMDMDEHITLPRKLEELEALKAYDAAKSDPDDAIPLDQALAETEKDREWPTLVKSLD